MSAEAWLLEQLSEHRLPMSLFLSPNLTICINVGEPPGGPTAIVMAIVAAWQANWVEFHLGAERVHPSSELDIHAWSRHPDSIRTRKDSVYVGLNATGARHFEHTYQPDWDRYVDCWEEIDVENVPKGSVARSYEARSRAFVEALVSIEQGRIRKSAPGVDWRPAYWLPAEPSWRVTAIIPKRPFFTPLPAWRGAFRTWSNKTWPWRMSDHHGWNQTAWFLREPIVVALHDVRTSGRHLQLHITLAEQTRGILEMTGCMFSFDRCRNWGIPIDLRISPIDNGVQLEIGWGLEHTAHERLQLRGVRTTWWTEAPHRVPAPFIHSL